jgi:hypothetical protein
VTVVDRMVFAGIYTRGRVLRDLPCPGGVTTCDRASGQTREGVRAQGGHRVVRFPLRQWAPTCCSTKIGTVRATQLFNPLGTDVIDEKEDKTI